MKIRNKDTESLGYSSEFNTNSISEIIVCYEGGDMSSEYISDYDVFVTSINTWMDMHQAFDEHLVIPNNENTRFGEPVNQKEKERGWSY
jgi:hypothetical protein